MMTSSKQGTASMEITAKSATQKQQDRISTMISSEKGNTTIRIPVKSAVKKQQDHVTMDAGGSKLVAASTKPNEDYVVPTGELKSAVKVPKLAKKEGYYWVATGDLKSAVTTGPTSVKQEGGYWVCAGTLKSQLPTQQKADGRISRRTQNRKLCISIGTIIGLIILAGVAGMAVGIYFVVAALASDMAPSAPMDEHGLLAYEAICVPHVRSSSPPPDVNWKECLVGQPPSKDSCSGSANCTFYSYRAMWDVEHWDLDVRTFTLEDDTSTVPMPYDEKLVTNGEKNATQLLCRTTSDKLGLCNGSTCTGARVEDKRSWYEKSKWEDNCDQPNPCWRGNSIINKTLSQNSVTRAECLKMDTTACNQSKYIAVIVWMQHLRCDSGKDRSKKVPCPGVPLKLWVCATCDGSVSSMEFVNSVCRKRKRRTWPCAFRCQRGQKPGSTTTTLTDGAPCLNITGGSDDTGYCFAGRCFHNFTVLNETNRHELEKTGCRNKMLK